MNKRIVILITETGKLKRISFKKLKAGDNFKLFEDKNNLIGEYFAKTNAYKNANNVWQIETI